MTGQVRDVCMCVCVVWVCRVYSWSYGICLYVCVCILGGEMLWNVEGVTWHRIPDRGQAPDIGYRRMPNQFLPFPQVSLSTVLLLSAFFTWLCVWIHLLNWNIYFSNFDRKKEICLFFFFTSTLIYRCNLKIFLSYQPLLSWLQLSAEMFKVDIVLCLQIQNELKQICYFFTTK